MEKNVFSQMIEELSNNGAEYVARAEYGEQDIVVLARRKQDNIYVTWMFSKNNRGLYWGHYLRSYDLAYDDFIERIRMLK
jgi:hypothetical protein